MKLSESDAAYLRAAEGWLELGDWHEANEELERIAASMRAHPEVLLVRAEVCAKAGKWDVAAELGERLSELLPKDFAVWLLLAEAFKNLGRIEEAYEALFSVAEQFFNEPEIHYRLA